MYSDIEIYLDNISENLRNLEHKTGYLHEKSTRNISKPLDIILEQNWPLAVTNNSECQEADHNSPKMF